MADLLTQEKEGLVCGSAGELAPALGRLRDSPEERRRMAQSARERSLGFAPGAFADRVRSFYADLPVRNWSTSAAWDAGETAG